MQQEKVKENIMFEQTKKVSTITNKNSLLKVVKYFLTLRISICISIFGTIIVRNSLSESV